MKKMIAITGCDSGIGKSLCQLCLEQEYHVVFSYLEENPFVVRHNAVACKMDITSEQDIHSFVDVIEEQCKEGFVLDALVNNAGVALGGPFENIPMDIFRHVFEINYFGLISLTQKLLPHIIQSKGKILVVGSLAGRIALPFLSPYASSKFALEGFCDSVRRELNPLGVSMINLEVGGVATPIWNKAKKQDRSYVDPRYNKSLDSFTIEFIEKGNDAMRVNKAVKQIYSVIRKKYPKPRYVISDNRLLDKIKMLIPDHLLDRIVVKLFHMYYG